MGISKELLKARAGGANQRPNPEAASALRQRMQLILALFLPAELAAGANVANGIIGQSASELVDILALLSDAQKPQPADGDDLGDGVLAPRGAVEVTGANLSVRCDPRHQACKLRL
jgi:hypothetical protein